MQEIPAALKGHRKVAPISPCAGPCQHEGHPAMLLPAPAAKGIAPEGRHRFEHLTSRVYLRLPWIR
jgi:hypothetical protein